MTRAIPTLAGLVTAISLAFAAPAATAPGPAYDACGLSTSTSTLGLRAVTVWVDRAPEPAESSEPGHQHPGHQHPVYQRSPRGQPDLPGEYEYIYPGAQCAVTSGS